MPTAHLVHLLKLPTVENPLGDASADVGGGAHAGGGEPGYEDGRGRPGCEGGQDSTGQSESSAHQAHLNTTKLRKTEGTF